MMLQQRLSGLALCFW